MLFTSSRLEIGDSLYPSYVSHQLTILSNKQMNHGTLIFSKAFQFSLWFFISIFFILCVAVNTTKVMVNIRKLTTNTIFDTLISIILDHFLISIGKSEFIFINRKLYQIGTILGPISRCFKMRMGCRITLAFWMANCAFWVQFFCSQILSTLANIPIVTIDSFDQLRQDYFDRTVLIWMASYLYHHYLKVIQIFLYYISLLLF